MEKLVKKIEEEKDVHIQLLREAMGDIRDQRNFFKILCLILCFLIFCFILSSGLIGYYDRKILSLNKHQETVKNVDSNGN